MTTSRVKFPCPVRRLNVAWRDEQWTIEKESRVESMTLPQSDDLPENAKEGGVSGFWYEGGQGDCKEARELIRRLGEIIERCCCGDQHASQAAAARLTTEHLLDEIRRRLEGK